MQFHRGFPPSRPDVDPKRLDWIGCSIRKTSNPRRKRRICYAIPGVPAFD
jgi:hypothetical protein